MNGNSVADGDIAAAVFLKIYLSAGWPGFNKCIKLLNKLMRQGGRAEDMRRRFAEQWMTLFLTARAENPRPFHLH